MVISCPECSKKFKFKGEVKSGSRFRCASCGAVFSGQAESPEVAGHAAYKVLAATENAMIAEAVERTLRDGRIAVEFASEGNQVMDIISRGKPQLLIIDAAIQGLFCFSICEKIKKDPALEEIRIILTSAAFNKNRYKRKPSELFGAEKYIEAHMLEDELAVAAGVLLGIEIKPAPVDAKTGNFEQNSSAVESVVHNMDRDGAKGADAEGKAKRLARIIAADILLYNRKKLSKKVQKQDALAMFSQEIEEAVKYFTKRLPGADTAHIHAAIEECLETINKVPANVSAC